MVTDITTESLEKAGVYKLTCVATKKCYVGSSVNIYHRLKNHNYNLTKGIHTNTYLQNTVNKYGQDSIRAEVLEYTSREEVLVKEKEWIDKLKPEFNFILDPVAKASYTPELREKLSMKAKAHAAKKGYRNPSQRAVECYTMEGEFVRSFDSMKEAAKLLGLTKRKQKRSNSEYYETGHITACCTGKRNMAYGYQWRYLGDKAPEALPPHIQKNGRKYMTTVVTNQLTGEKIEINNTTKLVQYLNLHSKVGNQFTITYKNTMDLSVPLKKSCELREKPEEVNPEPSTVGIQ